MLLTHRVPFKNWNTLPGLQWLFETYNLGKSLNYKLTNIPNKTVSFIFKLCCVEKISPSLFSDELLCYFRWTNRLYQPEWCTDTMSRFIYQPRYHIHRGINSNYPRIVTSSTTLILNGEGEVNIWSITQYQLYTCNC